MYRQNTPRRNPYHHHAALAIVFATVMAAFTVSSATAQTVRQFDTRHFTIIFDEDGEYTAGEIAKFCDDIYEDLLAQYNAFSDDPRIVCIVNDATDLANGYAVHYQNTITIYATSMDFELRGQSAWLRNVFVHEITHLVALKKAANGPLNAVVFGGGRYDKNPDVDVNLAWYHVAQPGWFSEGTAQLGAETFGSESWDTHRDMLLRSAWLADDLLSLPEMNTLTGRTTIGAELVYNQGYSLVSYIRDAYGYDTVVALNEAEAITDFAPAVKEVLGITPVELYNDWRASLDKRYASFRDHAFVTGRLVADKGSADYYPALSPDGRYLAFLSNRGGDHILTDLMLMDMATGNIRMIVEDVDYRVSWSHDSARLVYVKRPAAYPRYYDIFTYEVTTETEKRISKNLRARDPAFSPGDSLIVFIRNAQGHNQLGIISANGSGCRYLSAVHDGTQLYTPSFSPDGETILFCIYRQGLDRDIAMIDAGAPGYRHPWDIADSTSAFADSAQFPEVSSFRLLLGSSADERDPSFTSDGKSIVYVSDRTGVFNVYRLNLATGRTVRLTDCAGGAFAPSPDPSGLSLHYAGYDVGDFSIYRIDTDNHLETLNAEVGNRNYLTQPEPFDLSEYFDIISYSRKRIVEGIVPTLTAGPSFIGSRFGLDVIDAGAQISISDLIGYDAIVLGGSLGKNLREDVDLNSTAFAYYEHSLVPLTSSNYTHSPRFYAQISRVVINNLIGRLDQTGHAVFLGSIPELGYDNVIQDIHQRATIDDEYRDEFRRVQAGIQIPLANHHILRLEAGYRQYLETLNRLQTVIDYSSLYADGLNITNQVTGARTVSRDEYRYFTDMNYFESKEIGVTYSYLKTEPSADSDLSPKGTAFTVTAKHMRSAITDSLVDQPAFYTPVGIMYDGSLQLISYNPDPLLDQLRPDRRNRDLNEYTITMQKNTLLPWFKHTFEAVALGAYRDIRLKDSRKGEGSGYDWPLKYYLGGGNLLSGYPYFSFWGTKLAYVRLGYTFPVVPHIEQDWLGVQVQKLYGSVSFEAGNTWNFGRLSTENLKAGQFKRDVCAELRLGMVSFYRFPTVGYVRIAWPLDSMGDSPYENDTRRIYFGVSM